MPPPQDTTARSTPTMSAATTTPVVQVHGPPSSATAEILTPDALRLVGLLCAKFEDRRQALLEARKCRAVAFDAGEVPHFLPPSPATAPSWKCAPIPIDIQDRRVEITGPVDRKMVRIHNDLRLMISNSCFLSRLMTVIISSCSSLFSERFS